MHDNNIIILLLKDCLASLNGVFTTKDRYSSEPLYKKNNRYSTLVCHTVCIIHYNIMHTVIAAHDV